MKYHLCISDWTFWFQIQQSFFEYKFSQKRFHQRCFLVNSLTFSRIAIFHKTTGTQWETIEKAGHKRIWISYFLTLFFFYQGFLSQTLTIPWTAWDRWRPAFPLYHFRSLTNIHSLTNLHVRWLASVFNHTTYVYQTATRWDLPP